jgi:prevent-host-death family protein
MKRIPISELKAKLSEHLDSVRAGEEVIVTDRGRPVARIAPVRGHEEIEERLARLVRTGLMSPPDPGAHIDPVALVAVRPRVPGAGVLEALLEERSEDR